MLGCGCGGFRPVYGLKMGAASIFVIVEVFLPWPIHNILVPT
jgi:hypothetical protein